MEFSNPIILKLGGSVITNKNNELSDRPKVIDRISNELSNYENGLVIVHGAGSFGHPLVNKYKVGLGIKDYRRIGVSETKLALMKLNSIIVKSLKSHRIPSVPFMPSSFMTSEEGRLTSVGIDPLRRLLEDGYVPVLHGDLIADSMWGVSVISGDQIAVQLAKDLKASRVLFGCDVDGVFPTDPRSNSEAKLVRKIRFSELNDWIAKVGESTGLDVTGGMKGKLIEIARLADQKVRVLIFNLAKHGTLVRVLQDIENNCTQIIPG